MLASSLPRLVGALIALQEGKTRSQPSRKKVRSARGGTMQATEPLSSVRYAESTGTTRRRSTCVRGVMARDRRRGVRRRFDGADSAIAWKWTGFVGHIPMVQFGDFNEDPRHRGRHLASCDAGHRRGPRRVRCWTATHEVGRRSYRGSLLSRHGARVSGMGGCGRYLRRIACLGRRCASRCGCWCRWNWVGCSWCSCGHDVGDGDASLAATAGVRWSRLLRGCSVPDYSLEWC